MVPVLSARQLTDAEIGCRLLIVRIHDVCRYVRGEARPFLGGAQHEAFSDFFADNTLRAQRELDATPILGHDDSTATLVARHLFSDSMAQHLAVALAGRLPPVDYRANYHFATAFAATPEIAFDVASAYGDHRIADWQVEPEEKRVADCHRFRAWVDQNVPPTLLWGLWQRLEQERNLYLRWAAERGTTIEYSVPDWGSLNHEFASAMKVNPLVLGLGEAALRRDVDSWGESARNATPGGISAMVDDGNLFIERLLTDPTNKRRNIMADASARAGRPDAVDNPATANDIDTHHDPRPAGLDRTSVAVLFCLLNCAPALLTLDDIEFSAKVSRDTASKAIKGLIGDGLACRPKGERKGATVTDKGRELATQLRR